MCSDIGNPITSQTSLPLDKIQEFDICKRRLSHSHFFVEKLNTLLIFGCTTGRIQARNTATLSASSLINNGIDECGSA